MMETYEIRIQLEDMVKLLSNQINAVVEHHYSTSQVPVLEAKYKDGKPLVADLIVAKVNALVALANLKSVRSAMNETCSICNLDLKYCLHGKSL